ncbi:MAG: hypothetical protein H6Q99_3380 [Proteobacteria bacterium]|nr:hypothetical protein [Pseudomonadota bacterium]
MPGQLAIGVISYVVAVNLLAYAAMAFDKAKARAGSRRIAESTLLSLAMMGGSLGTVIAQQTIRHKTRKEPFRSQLVGIVLIQLLALIVLIVALVNSGSPDALWQRLTS